MIQERYKEERKTKQEENNYIKHTFTYVCI